MKLPLVTIKKNGSVFHVLKLTKKRAIGVCETLLEIQSIPFNQLDVLSEAEYVDYRAKTGRFGVTEKSGEKDGIFHP